jgi:predicted secreted protein
VATPLAGIGALIKAGANTIGAMNTWSITPKVSVKDTTSFQATGSWGTRAATIKEWTAKCDGFLDATDAGQVALINGLGNTFALEMDIDAAATHKWTGSAILTAVDPKADAKDMNLVTFTFDGTGPLTFT